MKLFIGIDLGTSGCRAVTVDEAGREHGGAARPLAAPVREGGHCEQDPRLWREAVGEVLRTLLGRIPAEHVAAVAVDGASGTLLLADAAGEPLGPALLYNDTRARTEAERVAKTAPPESGAHGASSSLAKLLWLTRNGVPPGACHALHPADWIAGWLMERYGFCDENNALKLGYDPVARRWPGWLEELGVPPGLLSRAVPPGTPLGTVSGNAARHLGLPASTVVVAGTTDSVAAALAAGIGEPGDAATSLGSTLVLKVACRRPVFAPEYGVYSHRVKGLWLAGGASNSGGAVLQRFFTRAHLDALSTRLDPDTPTGLDYYPLPAPGERFPVNDPALPPRLEPRPGDDAAFLQGLLEGMARIEARGYRLLARLGAPYPGRVLTTGGGARNPAWTRIRERELRVPVISRSERSAAYGAALLARDGYTRSPERPSPVP